MHRNRKKCGQVGQIENRIHTSTILCHHLNKHVTVVVSPQGNKCDEKTCQFSPSYVPVL